MPRIPTYDAHVIPQAPHVRRDVSYSAASFGAGDWAQLGGLAHAAGRFGDTLTGIGLNEMRKEQAEQEKAAAEAEREAKKAAAAAEREAESQARTTALTATESAYDKLYRRQLDYENLKGQEAVDGVQSAFDDGEAILKELQEQLATDPRAARRAEGEITRLRHSYRRSIIGHQYKQRGIAEEQALVGALTMTEKRFGMALRDASDYGEMDGLVAEGMLTAEELAAKKNVTDPTLRRAEAEKWAQGFLKRQIEDAMHDGKFELASGLKEHFKDKLAPAERDRLGSALEEERFRDALPRLVEAALEMEPDGARAAAAVQGLGDDAGAKAVRKAVGDLTPEQQSRVVRGIQQKAAARAHEQERAQAEQEAKYVQLSLRLNREPTRKEMDAVGIDPQWQAGNETRAKAAREAESRLRVSPERQAHEAEVLKTLRGLPDAQLADVDLSLFAKNAGVAIAGPAWQAAKKEIEAAKKRQDEGQPDLKEAIEKIAKEEAPYLRIRQGGKNDDGFADDDAVRWRELVALVKEDVAWAHANARKLSPQELREAVKGRLRDLTLEGELYHGHWYRRDPNMTRMGAEGEQERELWKPFERPANVPAVAAWKNGDFYYDPGHAGQAPRLWSASGQEIPLARGKDGKLVARVNGRYYAVNPQDKQIYRK